MLKVKAQMHLQHQWRNVKHIFFCFEFNRTQRMSLNQALSIDKYVNLYFHEYWPSKHRNMGRFKKKYFYVSRNKKKPLARKYEINKTCYLLMLLYNFCKFYNYSFNSLAIFCGNRIEL